MSEIPPRIGEALVRLTEVFSGTPPGVELVDTDVAELAGLEDNECRILLGVLEGTGLVERRRHRVFVYKGAPELTA